MHVPLFAWIRAATAIFSSSAGILLSMGYYSITALKNFKTQAVRSFPPLYPLIQPPHYYPFFSVILFLLFRLLCPQVPCSCCCACVLHPPLLQLSMVPWMAGPCLSKGDSFHCPSSLWYIPYAREIRHICNMYTQSTWITTPRKRFRTTCPGKLGGMADILSPLSVDTCHMVVYAVRLSTVFP